jgi:DEAD/DEAH box helicase domain-containing protein
MPPTPMEVNIELDTSTLSVLARKLGYPLRDWQVELTNSILRGNDVVLTAGTGQGKTTILYAPLLVTRLRNPSAVGLSVVPTKALGLDQVHSLPSTRPPIF